MVYANYKKIIAIAVIIPSISFFSLANGNSLNTLIEIQKSHHDSLPIFVMDMLVDPSMRRVENLVDQSYIDGLPRFQGGKEWKCLADALYFEARGEQIEGQVAVADVIINRKNSSQFPDTICGVVSEGAHKRHACQFSYNCDGKLELIYDKKTYRRIVKLSSMILNGAFSDVTNGATFFHASEVSPSWSKKFKKTRKIGRHIFYKN